MKTVRRLLYRDIVSSVTFVGIAFLSLFFFIDLVDQLDSIGQRGRTLGVAVTTALLALPGHLYELLPIAVLIGAIYALSRLAQNSEFTILRTGGLGPRRALLLLAALGAAFAALTFVVGDVVAPASERQMVLVKAKAAGGLRLSGPGAWLKERQDTPQGPRSVSVNVGGLSADGTMRDVRIFVFDAEGRLLQRLSAPRAEAGPSGWRLEDAESLRWPADDGAVAVERQATLDWPSGLDQAVVAAALLPAETMTTLELWRYSRHLESQDQAAQRYELQFWKRALYPMACVVMMALALPFAYLSARAGGVSLKVFGGIMLGISFVLLNNIAGHIGVLADMTPWMVSAAPGLFYLLLSLAAFAWLVRYR
ncbi:MAG: LPS export ABC transporter permease LptG [Burkholderiaceae bacterium]|nr:LPS export ABC transporter permease LptG [Rhodoferax sp.]MCP5285549.1 LPS export ABC transporter permease LptG [Burkholderiaceae bacterium]MCP5286380.1 LPS export ABC transporter permease LptG [Burkholderiaceae bacterium]